MSKYVRLAQTSQTLSLTAVEEASREGLREADLEHLLLALVLSPEPAGEVLRGLGITIERARAAVQEQHAAQLASLGIHAELPEPGRIVAHETDGYELRRRAADLIGRGAGKEADGSAQAVLRELVVEPSGLITDLLGRLGTTPQAVTAGLDDLSPGAKDGHPREGRGAAGSTEIFVPAPVEEVWDFLVDPARLPEWDAGTGNVDLNGEQDRVGGEGAVGISWTGEAPRARPDGKPVKVKDSVRRRHLELLAAVRPTHVAWRTSYPDAKVVIPVTTEFDLTATTGGTQLRISTSWRRSGGWRRAAGLPLRPLQKFFVWLSLVQIGGAVSRAFR